MRFTLLGVSAVALSFAPPAWAADCIVQCASQSCTVIDGAQKRMQLSHGERKQIEICPPAMMKGEQAMLYGVYQGPQGMLQFKINTSNTEFGALVPALTKANCAIGDSCLEERESRRVAQIGGMGADESKVAHEGQPCVRGLPCGVILKPVKALSFEIAGIQSGQLVLTAKRGAEKSTAAYPISNGRVTIPTSGLVAGGVYKYVLQNAGAPATAGEFSVMSSRMQADVQSSIDELIRTDPDRAAIAEIEILISEDLRWDATQRIR